MGEPTVGVCCDADTCVAREGAGMSVPLEVTELKDRVKQLEDSMEELASIMREEIAEIRRKVGNR